MAEWRFGQIQSSGFTNQIQQGFLELTPDAGNPFKRESFTDVQDLIKGSFLLKDVGAYNDFMSWYRTEIRQGTLSFDYYDCRVGVNRTARIVGFPAFATRSNRWVVSITLSLEPTTYTETFNLLDVDGTQLLDVDGTELLVDVELTV